MTLADKIRRQSCINYQNAREFNPGDLLVIVSDFSATHPEARIKQKLLPAPVNF